MREIKDKYWRRLFAGEKIPRKIKKAIIGTRPTHKALKTRIAKANIEIIKPFNNGYSYEYPNDEFCPYCGCEISRSTGNMVEYPEEWMQLYCVRCNKKVVEFSNGYVWHALMDFKKLNDGNP